MTVRIDGTNTSASPGITGTDTDTGLQFGTDEVNIVTGGSTRATVSSAGNLLFAASTNTADQSIQFGDPDATNRGFFNYRHSEDQLQIGAGGSTRVAINSDGGFAFNSGYGSVGVAYGVRAWVNFQGTGTVDIRADGNVDSITDNGTGDFTVNFTAAMPDDDYCVVGSVVGSTSGGFHSFVASRGFAITTSSCRFQIINHTGDSYDLNMIHIAVIR